MEAFTLILDGVLLTLCTAMMATGGVLLRRNLMLKAVAAPPSAPAPAAVSAAEAPQKMIGEPDGPPDVDLTVRIWDVGENKIAKVIFNARPNMPASSAFACALKPIALAAQTAAAACGCEQCRALIKLADQVFAAIGATETPASPYGLN